MDPKDKCEYLKYLSSCHRNILNGRFSVEWRALTFTLGYYILPIATIFNKDFSPPHKPIAFFVLIIAHVLVAILSIGFLRSLHKANAKNRIFAERAEMTIEEILSGKDCIQINVFHQKAINNGSDGPRIMWAWWWQVAIILMFAAISCVIVLCR